MYLRCLENAASIDTHAPTSSPQAAKINNSLLALGQCIQGLAKKDKHVPFRNSTLTMLLRSSLGGRVCTSVVVNVASEQVHSDETNCTLMFGSRMCCVKNKTVVNRVVDVAAELGEIELALDFAGRELQSMALAGQGGGILVSDTNAAERILLQQNLDKLDVMERDLQRASIALTEARGKGKATPALESRVKSMQAAIRNHGDVVERQVN